MENGVETENFLVIDEVTMPDGRVRTVVHKKHTVTFLLYDPVRDAVALVHQSRAPAISKRNPKGLVMEAPAVHPESVNVRAEIVREAWEKLGMRLREEQIRLLNFGMSLYVSPGWTSEMMILAYAQLEPGQCDEIRENPCFQEGGESTQCVWIPVTILAFKEMEDVKTFALAQWFCAQRRKEEVEELKTEVEAMRRMEDRF